MEYRNYEQTEENVARLRQILEQLKQRVNEIHAYGHGEIQIVEKYFEYQVGQGDDINKYSLETCKELFGFVLTIAAMVAPPFSIVNCIVNNAIGIAQELAANDDPKKTLPSTFISLEKAHEKICVETNSYISHLITLCDKKPEGWWKTRLEYEDKRYDLNELICFEDIDGETGAKWMKECIKQIRKNTWQYLLHKTHEVRVPTQTPLGPGEEPGPMNASHFEQSKTDDQLFQETVEKIKKYPNTFYNWDKQTNGYRVFDYYLMNKNAKHESSAYPPKKFCDELFIDNGYGTITNLDGVVYRPELFVKWTDQKQKWPITKRYYCETNPFDPTIENEILLH